MLAVRKSADSSGRLLTYGSSFTARTSMPIDVHKEKISNREIKTFAFNVTDGKGDPIDAYMWLPKAAEEYDVSKDLRDYIIVPNIPVILSDIPNTNGVAFSKEQLLKFAVKSGRLAFKTFKGKPTFSEHQNSDHTKAAGVILDVYADKIPQGKGIIKIVELLAFDRNKYPQLAKDILTRKRTSYSMGAYFTGFKMSDGSAATQARLKQPLSLNENNELVYKMVENIEGFETSSVGNPAFASANNDMVIEL